MAKNRQLEIHAKPEQPIQLNRKLIITVAATVVFIVLLAVVWALNSTEHGRPKADAPVKVTTDKGFVINPDLKDLPEDYSDVAGIKRYSPEPLVNNNVDLTVVQQQLDELKSAYYALKRQLSEKDKDDSEKIARNPRDEQAKISSLVFGLGGAGDSLAGQKKDFFEDEQSKKKYDAPDNPYPPPKNPTKYQILAGTIIPVTLTSAINSESAGQVLAQVRQNIYDTATGKYLLIPRGSKVIGEYDVRSIHHGQDRIFVNFTRIMRNDGTSMQIDKFSAVDGQGSTGLKGDTNNHWGEVIGTAVLSGLLSAGAGYAAYKVSNRDANRTTATTQPLQDLITTGAKGVTQVPDKMASRALDMKPTITVPINTPFNIFIKKDMQLTPYNDQF